MVKSTFTLKILLGAVIISRALPVLIFKPRCFVIRACNFYPGEEVSFTELLPPLYFFFLPYLIFILIFSFLLRPASALAQKRQKSEIQAFLCPDSEL